MEMHVFLEFQEAAWAVHWNDGFHHLASEISIFDDPRIFLLEVCPE
jgi:hypothetical protein